MAWKTQVKCDTSDKTWLPSFSLEKIDGYDNLYNFDLPAQLTFSLAPVFLQKWTSEDSKHYAAI